MNIRFQSNHDFPAEDDDSTLPPGNIKVNSQGTPKIGGFPQIWRNRKFQNWGIPPNLEKWLFFNLVFGREGVF